MTTVPSTVLSARQLGVTYATPAGPLAAVCEIDLDLAAGETLAIIGESGCGKSTLARALLGLLPAAVLEPQGALHLAGLPGRNLLGAPEALWRSVRGRRIGLVAQDPIQSLNPLMTVGRQLWAVQRAHGRIGRSVARARCLDLLAELEFARPERILAAYPFQLSGGQCQRVALALALINQPAVLVADEPTTALDPPIQREVLALIRRLQASRDLAVLLITHDVAVAAESADRVAVMYAGRIVERGAARAVLGRPSHPYARALLASLPRPGGWAAPPETRPPPPGACAFLPRCAAAVERCARARPELSGAERAVACWNPLADPLRPVVQVAVTPPAGGSPVLEVRDLAFERVGRAGWRRQRTPIFANVSFSLRPGETLGLVGESGGGKTTLARCLLRLLAPTAGAIALLGRDITRLDGEALRRLRPHLQPIFQDARGSLNPRRSVAELVREPLRYAAIGSTREQRARVAEMLDRVGLERALHDRTPGQLSTGQCQRVVIARALVTAPSVLICDEPFSALDLTVQARMLRLFADLQAEFQFGMVLISHDLRIVQASAQRVLVLHQGAICDDRPADQLARSDHPQTRALLDAMPPIPLMEEV
ncbi:MAG TPA: ABC transporter ATP-binding protein [Herpetosiphonaceae bacterium]|nr:ABC transporter ATP-binding protein [Herpetosiphonaceae bacterium]